MRKGGKMGDILPAEGWSAVFTWPLVQEKKNEGSAETLIMKQPLVCFALVKEEDSEEAANRRISGFVEIDGDMVDCARALNFLGSEAPGEEEKENLEEVWIDKAKAWQKEWAQSSWGMTIAQPALLPHLFEPCSRQIFLSEQHLKDLIASEKE
jgi:hypothetical protein